jgi:uncharacterized protein (TIGR02145 family)
MNGATSERAQGACPTGWHVPSDCEWKFLEHGIGMKISDTNALYFRAGIHPKLFSVGTGSGGNAGTNSSGFSILFSGSRDGGNGSFANLSTSFGIWLSSSPSGPSWRGIDSTIYSSYGDGNRAFSVRCLRD